MEAEDIQVMEVILGIFMVNDFEISIYGNSNGIRVATDVSIRGLFALASMPSHDCIANCTHEFSSRFGNAGLFTFENFYLSFIFREKGFVMTMKAVRKIKKGDDITHAYAEPLDPVLQRRGILQVHKT